MTDPTASHNSPPVVHLDPKGTDRHGEAARMRALGPVVRAVLPGDVQMWVVTDYALLADLAADPRVGRDWRNWDALNRGDVSDDWPLLSMIRLNNAMARDGAEHRRLRRPLTRTFTRSRVEQLRPRIEEIVAMMVDDLPNRTGPDGAVDLRRHYAYPFPMQVICELIGVPEAWRPRLRELIDTVVRADTTAEEYVTTQRERHDLWQRLFTLRRAEPADDLVSALIAVNDEGDDVLTDEELEDTLWMVIGAGHETSISLIVNAIRALLTHPDQLAIARDGDAETWAQVIEETLRWDAPVGNFPARFPMEDIVVGGVTIPKGEAILAPWSGVNRDPGHFGQHADRFDITRPARGHLAFGAGPHVCIGPNLARLEAVIALPAVFARYPDLRLAVDPTDLTAVPSVFSNSVSSLPVYLGPPTPA